MTVSEYKNKYYEFKDNYIGKFVDFDKQWGCQCLDLVQQYVTEEFGISWEILATNYAGNLNYEPKYSQMLTVFDEVPTTAMITGDIVVWSNNAGGHIAIFDSFDGVNCFYLTQNDGTGDYPSGATRCGILNVYGEAKAYRLKGVVPDEPSKEINIGDTIRIETIEPYKYYVADETKVLWGIYQIRENESAGGEQNFTWRDNGIPEICVDLVDENGNKLPNSDYTHCVAGDKFVFARDFKVISIAYENNMRYLYLDFDNNPENRFWVVDKYCKKV